MAALTDEERAAVTAHVWLRIPSTAWADSIREGQADGHRLAEGLSRDEILERRETAFRTAKVHPDPFAAARCLGRAYALSMRLLDDDMRPE